MKPIGPKHVEFNGKFVDKDAAMFARVFGFEDDVALMSPVTLIPGATRSFLDGETDPDWPARAIVNACAELEKKYDFMIIEGAGHGGVGSVMGVNNARAAALLKAPVLMVSEGGIGNVVDAVELNLALFEREKADVRIIMSNKIVPGKREQSAFYLKKAFSKTDMLVMSAFDYYPVLADPTLQHVADMFGLPLYGDQSAQSRICHTIQLGAASSKRVIDYLGNSTLLVVTSTRDELLITTSSLHHLPEYRQKLVGLVIGGFLPISEITQRILDDSNIPYIRIKEASPDLFCHLREHVSKIGPEDKEKIELINSLADQYIDFDAIDALL